MDRCRQEASGGILSQRMGGSALFEVDARSGANCIVVGTFDLGNPRPCSQYPSFLVGTSWWTDACESMWPHGHRRMLRMVPCYRFSTQAAASTVHDRIVCVCVYQFSLLPLFAGLCICLCLCLSLSLSGLNLSGSLARTPICSLHHRSSWTLSFSLSARIKAP